MTIFAVESLEEPRLRRVFTLFSVEYLITSWGWANVALALVVGVAVAIVVGPDRSLVSEVLAGAAFGALIMVSSFCHGLGHIMSSRVVSAPMQSIVLTATVPVTRYDDGQDQASAVHLGRSLGGPTLNLVVGSAALAAASLGVAATFVTFFGIVNLAFGVFTLLPVRSLDGSVILRELRDWRPRAG